MTDFFRRLWALGYSTDRATWVAHGLLALLIAAATNSSAALGFYYGGELRQIAEAHVSHGKAWRDLNWKDYGLDALFPLFAVGLWESAIHGQWLVFSVVLVITALAGWQAWTHKRPKVEAVP